MKRKKLVNRCLFSENNTVTFKDLAGALNAVRDYACNKAEFDNLEDTFLCELGLKWAESKGVYVTKGDIVVTTTGGIVNCTVIGGAGPRLDLVTLGIWGACVPGTVWEDQRCYLFQFPDGRPVLGYKDKETPNEV